MVEYIDREALIADLEKSVVIRCKNTNVPLVQRVLRKIMNCIKEQPTADVAEVRHGKWLKTSNETECAGYTFECSECGNLYFGVHKRNYCSRCRAKMDKE